MIDTDGPSGPPDKALPQVMPPETMTVSEEYLRIDKVVHLTGKVRIDLSTQTTDEEVALHTTKTDVAVQRHEIGRVIGTDEQAPRVRMDGDTTIIPILEEMVVTERRLVLRAELHVKVTRTAETEVRTIPLRRQTANVTRINPDPVPPAPSHDPKGD